MDDLPKWMASPSPAPVQALPKWMSASKPAGPAPLTVHGDLPSTSKSPQVPDSLAPEGGVRGFLREGAQQLGRVTEAPGVVGGQIKDDFTMGKDMMNLGRKEIGEGKYLEGAFDVGTGGVAAAASPLSGVFKALGMAMDPGYIPEVTGEAGRIAGEAPKAAETAKEAPKVPEAPKASLEAPIAPEAPKEAAPVQGRPITPADQNDVLAAIEKQLDEPHGDAPAWMKPADPPVAEQAKPLTVRPKAPLSDAAKGELKLERNPERSKHYERSWIYDVVDGAGNKVALLHGELQGSNFSVKYIAGPDGKKVPNGLGAATTRQIMRTVKEQFPQVKTITGQRISGARRRAGVVGAKDMVKQKVPEAPKVEAPAPKPLGAEAPPVSPALPERPSKPMIAEQDDRFFRLRQGATADKAELSQKVQALPREAKTPVMQEKLYRYMEGDPNVQLTPGEQAIYDQHIAPLKVEERALYEELKKTDLPTEDFDPEYAHRIVKGKAPQFDALEGDATMANPQGGTRSLPQSTSALKPRKYFVLEDEQGARRVVAIDKDEIAAVSKDGKPTPIPHTLDGPGVGDALSVGGKKWTIKNARTSEIEANTNTEYYKNAMANTVDNVARLRATARAVHEVQRLKDSPEFAAYARPSFAKDIPSNWREPTMPLFRDWRMEPRLANVIDDFYGKRSPGDALDWLAKVNRFAVGSLFWSPVPHGINAGAHWVTARGWDWITPKGVRSLVTDSAQAVRSVIAQDEKYQRMLRDGSGLVYGGVANKDFYMKMMKRLGEDVKANPAKWDPIARALGVGPSDVVKMLYSGANKALWAVSDMFMMQRVMELERKGMSPREAIAEAEKHIPNYRIPPEVLNSRLVSEALQNPNLTEFSRYHYGMLKSFGHMAKDMAVGTPKQKFETMGNIMATAALMTLVWPAINYGISKVTGNKDTTLGPKGSTTIPSAIKDMYNGDADWVNVLSNLVTIAPVLRAGLEAFPSNTNWFTGKRIADPDDARHGRIGRVAAQELEHAAQNIVQPYSMLNNADKTKKGLVEAVVDQGLGLRKRTKEQELKKKAAFKSQAAIAARRAKKPDGLIERGYGEAEKAAKKKINEYRGPAQ